jgi:hypothetical protein
LNDFGRGVARAVYVLVSQSLSQSLSQSVSLSFAVFLMRFRERSATGGTARGNGKPLSPFCVTQDTSTPHSLGLRGLRGLRERQDKELRKILRVKGIF